MFLWFVLGKEVSLNDYFENIGLNTTLNLGHMIQLLSVLTIQVLGTMQELAFEMRQNWEFLFHGLSLLIFGCFSNIFLLILI